MYGDRRRTGGISLNGRASLAITPTKRYTDFATLSTRKTETRPSLGQSSGQHRLSIFHKTPSVAPRDVKSIFTANVSKVHNFLAEHEGLEAPLESTIRNPRGRNDFICCFELIYQHLSKDYEFRKDERIEDEISQIFKGLGYPFALKNSYFQPMGSSHGYPHLLDALAWLVDIIRVNAAVSADTQNIIFGYFMEQSKAQERTLHYAWMSSIFREYTNERKVAENSESPFWGEVKNKLRKFFEDSGEFEDMTNSAASALEMLRFECDEIESEKDNEQSILEEITRIKDDIRKASAYLETTQQVLQHKEIELAGVQSEVADKIAENEKVQKMVNDLKTRIENQKNHHGLTGKEVRELNLENNRDKEMVSEIQAELNNLSKETWRLKDEDHFKEQRSKFVQLFDNVTKMIAGLNIQMNFKQISSPNNERELKVCWETLDNVWLPEINRQLHQRKLDLETEQSIFSSKFVAAAERIQMKSEILSEVKKNEIREERLRRNERDEWKEDRKQKEKRYDELENEKEVLKTQMQMDGSLEKEIEAERINMAKIEKELEEKCKYLQSVIKKKLDQIVAETTAIESQKTIFHLQCTEIEKAVN